MSSPARITIRVAAASVVAAITTFTLAAAPAAHEASTSTLAIGGDVIRHDSIQNLIIAKDIQFTNGNKGGNCDIWN